MSKNRFAAVTAMMILALALLCSACGGGDKDPAKDPEATDLPKVTAPPSQDGDQVPGGLAADDNHAPEGMTREEWLASMGEDQRKAEELVGHDVQELYDAIGKPKSAVYTASCLVEGGEDGILTYDDFFVSTTRSNGSEFVMGTGN